MDTTRWQDLLDADGARLVEAARAAGPGTAVPTCPGWTVADLAAHTAEVFEHKLVAIELGGPRPDPWPPSWPADRDPVEWLADAHRRLLAVLRSTPADAVSWTWDPADQTAGFWSRRMAHETAVHRFDAEAAAGAPTPVDHDLAADGVDEVLTLFLGGDWSSEPQPGSVGTVLATTGDRSWHVTLAPERVDVQPGDAPADLTVTAGASDLDLWLWGRRGDEVAQVVGDPAVAGRFRARLVRATQ